MDSSSDADLQRIYQDATHVEFNRAEFHGGLTVITREYASRAIHFDGILESLTGIHWQIQKSVALLDHTSSPNDLRNATDIVTRGQEI